MSLEDYKDLGTRAIREDAPAGSSVRDDPDFESLQLEIRKLEAPDGVPPEWSAVVEKAALLLERKSKDLLVAAYFGLGLLHREGYAGLAVGLGILGDMVETYWETLYPELNRLRGRVAALEWLAERAAKAIELRPSTFGPADGLHQSLDRLGELLTRLEARAPGSTESLAVLRRALEQAEARYDAPPAAAASTGPSLAVAPAPFATIQSADDATRALQQFRELGRRIGEFHRSSDPGDPLGYRVSRLVSWAHLKELPPHTGDRTQIPPPLPADFGAKAAEMLERGQWAGVIEQAETRFATAILWLDLHRLTAAALEGMGHAAAAQAVAGEVGALLRRLPGLEMLRFADEQPLADDATRAWITARARPAVEGAETPEPAPTSAPGGNAVETADVAELPTIRVLAQDRARKKKLPEGLELLGEHAGRARTLRGRVRWELEAARLCLQSGRPETAYAQLQSLDETLCSSRAEDWAPELCAEVLKNLFLAHRDALSSVSPRPAEEVARSREYRRRLSRIDVVAALSLEDRK
jgi:type VI secretion system protein VasJ